MKEGEGQILDENKHNLIKLATLLGKQMRKAYRTFRKMEEIVDNMVLNDGK